MDVTLKSRLQRLSTCDISDALVKLGVDGDGPPTGGLIPDLQMFSPERDDGSARMVGPVYTVLMVSASDQSAPKPDKHFVDACPSEHIILLQMPRGSKAACWGGLMSTAAKRKGVLGAVIDGGCRDLAEHRAMEFPVWARHHSTLGQGTFVRPSELNIPLRIPASHTPDGTQWPDTIINPGDILVCDIDGCVVIPRDRIDGVVDLAEKGTEIDQKIARALGEGMGVAEAMKKYRT